MEKNGREGHAAEPAAAGAGIQRLRKQFPERARIVRLRKKCFSPTGRWCCSEHARARWQ